MLPNYNCNGNLRVSLAVELLVMATAATRVKSYGFGFGNDVMRCLSFTFLKCQSDSTCNGILISRPCLGTFFGVYSRPTQS